MPISFVAIIPYRGGIGQVFSLELQRVFGFNGARFRSETGLGGHFSELSEGVVGCSLVAK